ncbi:MAG: hypothetical protein ABEL51_00180 [Salinibacter sp.]
MRSSQISSVIGRMLVGLFLLAACARPHAAGAQPAFPGAPDELSLNLRLYPLDTWSPRVGVGMGAGLVIHHLGRRHAQGLLTVAPARHEQVATLAWASANPKRARRYVLVNARGLHTNRDWFYGLGPRSSEGARQSIERSALQMRVRAGRHFLNRRLLVQPHLGLSAHRVDRVPTPGASALTPRSQRHLRQLASEQIGPLSPTQTGLRIGVELQYDTRSATDPPSLGVILDAGWSRYVGVSSFLHYDRFEAGASGVFPLGGTHRLVGHLSLAHVAARGRAAVPYYLRPTLDGPLVPGWAQHRFVDSDRLIGSLLYRFPIAQPFGLAQLEGHLGAHAASVYDDVFADAALEVSFAESVSSGSSTVPLRPAASLGLHLNPTFRQTPSLDLALGVSPEGVTAVRFTLTRDLQALRQPHHRIRR